MSFNKRTYNWESIQREAINKKEFASFDNWILKPDAHITEDKQSSMFLKIYTESDKESRILLMNCILDNSKFTLDLLKCINVLKNPKNKKTHDESIRKYTEMFNDKWPDLFEKYKSLLIQNN